MHIPDEIYLFLPALDDRPLIFALSRIPGTILERMLRYWRKPGHPPLLDGDTTSRVHLIDWTPLSFCCPIECSSFLPAVSELALPHYFKAVFGGFDPMPFSAEQRALEWREVFEHYPAFKGVDVRDFRRRRVWEVLQGMGGVLRRRLVVASEAGSREQGQDEHVPGDAAGASALELVEDELLVDNGKFFQPGTVEFRDGEDLVAAARLGRALFGEEQGDVLSQNQKNRSVMEGGGEAGENPKNCTQLIRNATEMLRSIEAGLVDSRRSVRAVEEGGVDPVSNTLDDHGEGTTAEGQKSPTRDHTSLEAIKTLLSDKQTSPDLPRDVVTDCE